MSIDIKNIKVITILKKSKFLERAGLGILIGGGNGALLGYLIGGKGTWGSRGESAASGALFFSGLFLLATAVTGEKEEDELIQIEGRPDLEINMALEKLRKKARIPDYQ